MFPAQTVCFRFFDHLKDLLERSDDRLLDHEDQLGSLVLDLARGLAHLHACGTGHGNLKSTNCLVDDHWTLRLADFGLAAWRPRPGRAFGPLSFQVSSSSSSSIISIIKHRILCWNFS